MLRNSIVSVVRRMLVPINARSNSFATRKHRPTASLKLEALEQKMLLTSCLGEIEASVLNDLDMAASALPVDNYISAKPEYQALEENQFNFGDLGKIGVVSYDLCAQLEDRNISSGEFRIVTELNSASPGLLAAMVAGHRFDQVSLSSNSLDSEKPLTYSSWELNGVTVKSYRMIEVGGDGMVPRIELTLKFDSVKVQYTPSERDGQPGAPVEASWALESNRAQDGSKAAVDGVLDEELEFNTVKKLSKSLVDQRVLPTDESHENARHKEDTELDMEWLRPTLI